MKTTKTNKQFQKEFIQFLKDNDALIPFCVNLAIQEKASLSQFLTRMYRESYDLSNIITAAFIFRTAPEVYGYWNDLHFKWIKRYRTLT